jgi:hypothetical protein
VKRSKMGLLLGLVLAATVSGTAAAKDEVINPVPQCANGNWNSGAGKCDCNVGYVPDGAGGCMEQPKDGLPGNQTPPNTPPPPPGGGGGNEPPPCDAQCQKEQAKKKCVNDANAAYNSCKAFNDQALNFCKQNWALDVAVGQCTAGQPGSLQDHGGIGIDGKLRKRIWGPMKQLCKPTVVVDPKTGESWEDQKCVPVSGPSGYPFYTDDELGWQKSAWSKGKCGPNGYTGGGCLDGWINGRESCTVTEGKTLGEQKNLSMTVTATNGKVTGSASGGGSSSSSTTTTWNISYTGNSGLVAGCSSAYSQAMGNCLSAKNTALEKCSKM